MEIDKHAEAQWQAVHIHFFKFHLFYYQLLLFFRHVFNILFYLYQNKKILHFLRNLK